MKSQFSIGTIGIGKEVSKRPSVSILNLFLKSRMNEKSIESATSNTDGGKKNKTGYFF